MDRTTVDHISSRPLSDIENLLADRFGDRFRSYRENYRKSINYDKNGYIPEMPLTVTFELVNRCNLECIMCYTSHHKESKSTLKIGTIQSVMQECGELGVPAVVVGLGSEALLYKNIKEVLALARKADVMDVWLSTNATLLNRDLAEFIIDSEIARVVISLDAATPETYAAIRRKGELQKVEENIMGLVSAKRNRNSTLPLIRLSYVVQEKNAMEVEHFFEKWKDYVDYIDFQECADFRYVGPLLRGEMSQLPDPEEVVVESNYCAYPFNSLHVWADGAVTPCCTFYAKALTLGNANKQSLSEIWHGEKINEIRQEILTGNLNDVCRFCLAKRENGLYQTVKKSDAAE